MAMNDIFGAGPYSHTGRDVFNKVMASLLGSIIPGGEVFAGLASGPLQTILGIQNDAIMDTVLFTNMTPYGSSRVQDNAILQRLSQAAMGSTTNAAKYQSYQALAKTLTSFEAWQRLEPVEQLGSYENFINTKANSYMSNIGFNMAYEFLDPLGMKDMNKYMSMAAGNLTRFGLQAGNRNAYINTKSILGGMFRDEDGNYSYDKRDWGYFTNGEVAALTAAITKHVDMVGDADVSNPESLKAATNRLKDTVQKYAKALSPLKDIFGSDIPSMIRSIEELTGQDIAQMGTERARAVATMALDRTSTGRYSMSDLSEWSNQFNTLMRDMSVPTLNKMNGTMYAAFALDAVHGGGKPRYMQSSAYMNAAAEQVIRTANSEGADQFDMAYALWAEKEQLAAAQKGTQADVSIKRFNELLATGSGNIQDRMLQLAGVQNRYDLREGMNSDYYIQAKESGFGAMRAFDANMDRIIQRSQFQMSHDTTILNDLSRRTGNTKYDQQTASTDFQRTIDYLKSSPEIINLRGDEQVFAIAKQMGLTGFTQKAFDDWKSARKPGEDTSMDAFIDSVGLTDTQVANLQSSRAIATRIVTDGNYKDLHAMLFMRRNQVKQAEAAMDAAGRRTYTEALDAHIGSAKEAFLQLFGVADGSGLDTSRVSQWLTSAATINAVGSESAKAESMAAIEAATITGYAAFTHTEPELKELFSKNGVYGENSEAFKHWQAKPENKNKTYAEFQTHMRGQLEDHARSRTFEHARDTLAYVNSAAGLSNTGFREMLGKYMAVQGDSEEANTQRHRYGNMMTVYRLINEDAVNRFLDSTKVTDSNDTDYKAWLGSRTHSAELMSQFNAERRQAQMDRLAADYNAGNVSYVRGRIENTSIGNSLNSFIKIKPGEAVTEAQYRQNLVNSLLNAGAVTQDDQGYKQWLADNNQQHSDAALTAYNQKRRHETTGFGGQDSTDSFDADKFNAWIDTRRKQIKDSGASDDEKKRQEAALDALASHVTQARGGVTAQANPITDALKTIVKLLTDLVHGMPKPGENK